MGCCIRTQKQEAKRKRSIIQINKSGMKKNLFFTLFLVLLFAGTNSQDIKFMGLDLNTNFETFCQKLKEKGLVLEASKLTTKEFKGTFAGYKNCEFIITCTDNTKVVKSVEVIFPFDNDEYERNRAWNDIIKQYEAKYGKYTVVKDGGNIVRFFRYDFANDKVKIVVQRTGPSDFSDNCAFSIVYQNLKVINESSTGAGRYSDDL